MAEERASLINRIVEEHGKDRTRLMDIAHAVHKQVGHFSEDTIAAIAHALGIHHVEVRDMVSFYAFLPRAPKGVRTIRLCTCASCRMKGMAEVAAAFEKAVGAPFGSTSADGTFSLEYTNCIGMCDQAPAALVDGTVLTSIKPGDVPQIVTAIKEKGLTKPLHGTNALGEAELNLRQPGPVIFAPMERGAALRAALNIAPEAVINALNKARLRGRGGAGFPTAMKWDLCRKSKGDAHYIVCNADEGEPGTFKDRVILTEQPDLVFEGMTIGGYALGANEGLLYLRGEYEYLLGHLNQILAKRRRLGLLGENVCGREGFNFDIRIVMGAGAYICGEESSLIESLEGKRGAPRDRPPFPVQKGYLGQPTSVNNVETLCCVARILEKGADWFIEMGTKDSTGTKLLSVSGDCEKPGVYEVEFGLSVEKLLDMVGARDTQAVQMAGPSGQCLAPKDFGRFISFEDLPTGGSIMIFGPDRDVLEYVQHFIDFFREESCGWCAPCRVGTTLIQKMLDRILEGNAMPSDVDRLADVCQTIKTMSRCGLGQAAPNPILTTLRSFRHLYEQRLKPEGGILEFDYEKAMRVGCESAGRPLELEGENV